MTLQAATRHVHSMSHYNDSHKLHRRSARAPYPTLNAAHSDMQAIFEGHTVDRDTDKKPQKIYRISTRRIKRVPVTSCDSCRLRKLKCNAKELPQGATCSQCKKHNTPCTFEDRDEVASVPIRKVAAAASVARPAISTTSQALKDNTIAQMNANRQRSANIIQLPPLAPSKARQNAALGGAHDLGAYSLGAAALGGCVVQGEAEQYDFLFAAADRSLRTEATLSSTWRQLGMPTSWTDLMQNQVHTTNVSTLLQTLAHRFLNDDQSFNNLIVANRTAVTERMRRMMETGTVDYFILTIVACAVLSEKTVEPELIQWRQQLWRYATEAVQEQVDYAQATNNLELVQALLLLSACWPGELTRPERINTFDAATSFATSLNLHSSSYLTCGVGSAAERVALFWFLYSYDKILSTATRRTISIPRISHDMPMMCKRDFAQLGMHLSSYEEICLQRLLNSFVSLCQILEGLQDCQQATNLQYVMQSCHVSANKLEQFCLDNEWYMSKSHSLPLSCRSLAEAITSQMHLTRLQLFGLHVKVDLTSRTHKPVDVSAECHESMGAAIASAWHLIQRGGQTAATMAATIPPYRFTATTFSSVCFTFGSDFFRFLASHWSEWQGGRGCLSFQQNLTSSADAAYRRSAPSPAPSYASTSAIAAMADVPNLDIETLSTTEQSTAVNSVNGGDDDDDEQGEELILPEKSSSMPQCDTATLFSMILNSPAAQFFSQSQAKLDLDTPPRSPSKLTVGTGRSNVLGDGVMGSIMSVQGGLLSAAAAAATAAASDRRQQQAVIV